MQASARSTLLALVEEHLANLIREAESVKRHCKRARLHPEASTTPGNSSSSNSNSERMTVRRRLHAADINMALEMQGSEKLYGAAVVDPTDDPAAPVLLKDFLQHSLMPAAPLEVGLHMHWLAVDGVQPEIPQNPMPVKSSSSSNNNSSAVNAQVSTSQDALQEAAVQDAGGVRVNRLQASLLSEELQLYFTRVCLAMERGGAVQATLLQQDAIIASVATDTGLQELVPFLVRYCQHELYWFAEKGHVEHCRTLVRLATALLQNRHLHLELHLHELLPALMTCVVAKRLSASTNATAAATTSSAVKNNTNKTIAAAANNHYALRREAAAALVHACRLFGDEYATLKARVLRTLCNAVAADQAPPSRYGGLVAIALFGSKAIDAFVLPVAASSWKHWQDRLAVTRDAEEEMDIRMCQQAVLEAMGMFFQRVSDAEKAARLDWQDFEETFGDSLVVLQGGEPSEYATCFV
jgi:transcription initiation factor TFIID subunit 6